MLKNRLLYLGLLIISGTLFVVHGAWFYWILLLTLLCLPFVSLLFSLPAMLCFRLSLELPEEAMFRTAVQIKLQGGGIRWLPKPFFRLRLQIMEHMTGTEQKKKFYADTVGSGLVLHPPHCGSYTVSVSNCCVYDALGLWRLPRRLQQTQTLLVLPQPERPSDTSSVEQLQPVAFQPKPGGASEIHDHREYRPGDSVKEIRWKLSCKSDKLIVREPLIPVQQLVVAVEPAMDADTLDRTLARLYWVSQYLCAHELPHTVLWRDAACVKSAQVRLGADVERMMKQAVLAVPAPGQTLPLDSCVGAQIIFLNGKEGEVQP